MKWKVLLLCFALTTAVYATAIIPSTQRHNVLDGLQGGTAGEYYHLTGLESGYLDGLDQALKTTNSPTFAGLTLSGLTNQRLVLVGVNGTLGDNAKLYYDGTTSYLYLNTGRLILYQPGHGMGIKVNGYGAYIAEYGDFAINSSGNFVVQGSKSMSFTAIAQDMFFTIPTGRTMYFRVNAVSQVQVSDGKLFPTTTNDIDLGDATHYFKDGYFDTVDATTGYKTNGVAGKNGTYTIGGGGSGDVNGIIISGGLITGVTTIP